MNHSLVSRPTRLVGCAAAALAGVLLLWSLATQAQAFGCRTVGRTKLVAVDPAAVPKIRAKAAVLSCADGSALIDVKVKQKVPDGTAFLATLPGIEPILGEWFYIAKNKGEGFINLGAASQAQGRAIAVVDQDFNELATGVFP